MAPDAAVSRCPHFREIRGVPSYYTGLKRCSHSAGGATGLHRAAYCGHEDVVRVLVRGGAEGGRVDSDGRTPLHKVNPD